ncbi:hypothetical protein [Solimicrobium silvestre]|uniref:Uncharacterized protein n=1 Tax=Solimicrobium silvestre TaxID=2099400 RepID=A0A2S9GSV5_9BURK|nr:hypothetical protein [Solimicrobium silvestre]PRC90799.1 hypothetical protein S2091_4462 [Solimicrobium silvestre]
MTSTDQSQTQKQAQFITSHAIDTVDAYTLAHDIVSDLSAIFELLEKLDFADYSNERLSRILSEAGFRHAADRLQLIDEKIIDAKKTLDELIDANKSNMKM